MFRTFFAWRTSKNTSKTARNTRESTRLQRDQLRQQRLQTHIATGHSSRKCCKGDDGIWRYGDHAFHSGEGR